MDDIDFYYAERKFNQYLEEFIIHGYNKNYNLKFYTIITRLNILDDLVKNDKDNEIIVKSGNWYYKISTVFSPQKFNIINKKIKFNYNYYKLPKKVYICFIGTLIVI
jgi:hypothetical protein